MIGPRSPISIDRSIFSDPGPKGQDQIKRESEGRCLPGEVDAPLNSSLPENILFSQSCRFTANDMDGNLDLFLSGVASQAQSQRGGSCCFFNSHCLQDIGVLQLNGIAG